MSLVPLSGICSMITWRNTPAWGPLIAVDSEIPHTALLERPVHATPEYDPCNIRSMTRLLPEVARSIWTISTERPIPEDDA